MPLKDGRYTGPLFRALNPVYARAPLSGRGAELHGGRFNAKGTSALYTSLDPATALREANQVGSLQPTILVSYKADLGPIFDTRDQDGLERYGTTAVMLADPAWRMKMLDGHQFRAEAGFDFIQHLYQFAQAALRLVRTDAGSPLQRVFAQADGQCNLFC